MTGLPTTVVIPTVGRLSLDTLLSRLRTAAGPRPAAVIVVDDRPAPPPDDPLTVRGSDVRVVRSGGAGPAAARNLGWRLARTPWVSFVDDDVVPDAEWFDQLSRDLAALPDDVGGSQGLVTVPLPSDRRPTDWERGTAGLEYAVWITADMTYRRSALAAVGGFDERFRRAYREDADLALRVIDHGWRLVRGTRRVTHPVRAADAWASVRAQAGNADDALMRRLHGRDWRVRAVAPAGRRPRHVAVTLSGAAALGLAATGRWRVAALAAGGWLAGTAELAVARIAPGPRDRREVTRMVLTSAVIPAAATWHTVRGLLRHRSAGSWRGHPELVLFDRDGTLVHNVPYNGDPDLVTPMPTAVAALARLRASGIRVGVVTNQSGVASGRLTEADVRRVNDRVERLLGPFDVWRICPHGPDDGCDCRKPAPEMIKSACAELDVDVSRCVVVGDIGSDVAAARAAGASGILVPTPLTRASEVRDAERTATDLASAVTQVLAGAW